MNNVIEQLGRFQDEIIGLVAQFDETHIQHHHDLSPVGWHLGHCIYTENYWIREKLLAQTGVDDALRALYVPELSDKKYRGHHMPDKKALLEWACEAQYQNRTLLQDISKKYLTHRLMHNDYLLHFLINHYAQHLETIAMVKTEQRLSQTLLPDPPVRLSARALNKASIKIEAGPYLIGADGHGFHYDNELDRHQIALDSYEIALHPVNNAVYLAFMEDGGYQNKRLWSEAGWQWTQNNMITHPHHWRADKHHTWFGVDMDRARSLVPDKPVYGLSGFEAQAFSNWAGARLPHEYEWEVAKKTGQLEQVFEVWEWCANTLHAYPNFTPYPYDRYSLPYFDERHVVLRGGSLHSRPPIKRDTFRNYYTMDKRHIFAGLRLVFS